MYIHPKHRVDDPAALLALVEAHPLGAWVCQGADGLLANHLPWLLDRGRGPCGTLLGHVARANPVWRLAGTSGLPSLVLFQGPQAYITPGWYPGKAQHGRVVPTWNYAVAQVHGTARAVHDRGWLLDLLNRLTDRHEAGRPQPWRLADAPAAYTDAMLGAVVGIEIPIERLTGKHKASQDEDLQDRQGTVRGLRGDRQPGAAAVADLVQQALDAEAGKPG